VAAKWLVDAGSAVMLAVPGQGTLAERFMDN